MSFQAYLDNIKAKTGHSPEQFKKLAIKAGVYSPDMKASQLVAWLEQDFGLGRGHSMALWAVFKHKGWVEQPLKNKATKAVKPVKKSVKAAKATK